MKNKKKFSLNSLFYNNRFLMFFSIFAAVIVWLAVVLEFSPEDERVIEKVPVTIEQTQVMSDFGLQAFGETEYTVDVTVYGKRYIVSPVSLETDDIVVKANTKYVDSAGQYTLTLVASSVDENAEFEITDISLDSISVYFDVETETEFAIEAVIDAPSGIAPEGYHVGDTVMSSNTVTVSGPSTQIERIEKVTAAVSLESQLTQTESFGCDVKAVDSNGYEPEYLTYSIDTDGFTMTIPVYKTAMLSASVSFINSPANYIKNPLSYTVSPSTALFGVNEGKLENLNGIISVATIDFSDLKPGINTFIIDSLPVDSGVLLDGTESFEIVVDVPDVFEETFEIPVSGIQVTNIPRGITPEIVTQGSITVTVVGTQEELAKIDEQSISLQADASELKFLEKLSVPVKVIISDSDFCWASGDYEVTLSA
ncbi:MAG: hypothetical protein IJC37_02025 [Clostridia bacterium]|nr:hypothetical protein [Clostridia bacterium]